MLKNALHKQFVFNMFKSNISICIQLATPDPKTCGLWIHMCVVANIVLKTELWKKKLNELINRDRL